MLSDVPTSLPCSVLTEGPITVSEGPTILVRRPYRDPTMISEGPTMHSYSVGRTPPLPASGKVLPCFQRALSSSRLPGPEGPTMSDEALTMLSYS